MTPRPQHVGAPGGGIPTPSGVRHPCPLCSSRSWVVGSRLDSQENWAARICKSEPSCAPRMGGGWGKGSRVLGAQAMQAGGSSVTLSCPQHLTSPTGEPGLPFRLKCASPQILDQLTQQLLQDRAKGTQPSAPATAPHPSPALKDLGLQ